MIAIAQVATTLQPWLGQRFLSYHFDVVEEIAFHLNAYNERSNLNGLRSYLDSLLFQTVRSYTNTRMVIITDDDVPVRVQISDFSVMTDDLMLLLFMDFKADEKHLLMIREYALQNESLAALRALYTRFSHYHSPEELQVLARTARGCHPEYRLRGWLI